HNPISPPTSFSYSQHTPTAAFSTLSLHDALPIWYVRPSPGTNSSALAPRSESSLLEPCAPVLRATSRPSSQATIARWYSGRSGGDRKSTRLNSSHVEISYAVFCLKKKKKRETSAR